MTRICVEFEGGGHMVMTVDKEVADMMPQLREKYPEKSEMDLLDEASEIVEARLQSEASGKKGQSAGTTEDGSEPQQKK